MLNDTIGRNTEPSNWYVRAINAPSDKYKLSDIQCNVDYFFQLWFGIRSLGVVVMLEGEVKLRLGHFLVYGSREKCVQYCCWWRIIIRNYLRPVHASSETTYEARVLYVEGVCVCVCLNSNVYRSFIKADSRRKQSLNTAIWPALARAGCLQTFSLWYEGLQQKLRPTAGSGLQPSDWRALRLRQLWRHLDHEALASVIIIVMRSDKWPGLTYHGPDWAQLGLGVWATQLRRG